MVLSVSDSTIKVANAALNLLGVRAITSFEENSIAGRTLNTAFEDALEEATTKYPWRFCTRRVVAQRDEFDFNDNLPAPWTGGYVIPYSIRMVRTVYVDDVVVPFDVFERYVAVMVGENSTSVVRVEGVVAVSPQYWPGHFRSAFIAFLAGKIAMPITHDERLADYWIKTGEELLARGASRDSQGRTQQRLNTKMFIRQRRTGGRNA